jgi:hypothetical protein
MKVNLALKVKSDKSMNALIRGRNFPCYPVLRRGDGEKAIMALKHGFNTVRALQKTWDIRMCNRVVNNIVKERAETNEVK